MDEKTMKMIDPDDIDETNKSRCRNRKQKSLKTIFTDESEVVELPMIPLRGLIGIPEHGAPF